MFRPDSDHTQTIFRQYSDQIQTRFRPDSDHIQTILRPESDQIEKSNESSEITNQKNGASRSISSQVYAGRFSAPKQRPNARTCGPHGLKYKTQDAKYAPAVTAVAEQANEIDQ